MCVILHYMFLFFLNLLFTLFFYLKNIALLRGSPLYIYLVINIVYWNFNYLVFDVIFYIFIYSLADTVTRFPPYERVVLKQRKYFYTKQPNSVIIFCVCVVLILSLLNKNNFHSYFHFLFLSVLINFILQFFQLTLEFITTILLWHCTVTFFKAEVKCQFDVLQSF